MDAAASATNIESGCQVPVSTFNRKYLLVTEVKAPYPSPSTYVFQRLMVILSRAVTCSWCCGCRSSRSKKRQQENNRLRDNEENLLGFTDEGTGDDDYRGRHCTSYQASSLKSPIAEIDSFYSWGNAVLRPIISNIGSELLDEPRDCCPAISRCYQRTSCTVCCKALGTPRGPAQFCKTFLAWIFAIMSFPFIILGAIWDFILFPLVMTIVLILAILCEPIGAFASCCCGMTSHRGYTLYATVYERYHLVNTTEKDGLQIETRHQAVCEFILAEHVNPFKAICLQVGASNPRMSQYQALVCNPVWGMFHPHVSAESVASAWFQLIHRCGGEMPMLTGETSQWDNNTL